MKKFPNTNLGWHKHYVRVYNETLRPTAGYLADLYLLFHLAFNDEKIPA